MNRNSLRTATSIGLSVLLAAGAVLVSPLAASAAGAGVGDVSDAVLYGPTGPIGDVLTDLSDEDDETTTIAATFPINFFGTKSDGLCITTNGVVAPVATSGDGCSDDYDVDLNNLAVDSQQSIIGALMADLDLGETLYKTAGPVVDTTLVSVAGQMVTFTTATANPFSVGDFVNLNFTPDQALFNGGVSGTVASIPAPNQFVFDFTGSGIPDTAEEPALGTAEGEGTEYTDTNSDGLADDGFGAVKQVYAGATTVDGKPAFAITWYRVPTNDDENSELLSNTFQIVIIQEPTVNGDTLGYDFSVQFNFGTLTDGNDGHLVGSDGSVDCDSDLPETCSWSVGWAKYDSVSDTADVYEFFKDVPVTDLIDGAGNSALVNNRLNTDVYGRYVISMFGGVTAGFAVPVLSGRTAEAAAPTQLPNTGVDAMPLIVASLLLLLAGAGLLVSVRRRQSLEQA